MIIASSFLNQLDMNTSICKCIDDKRGKSEEAKCFNHTHKKMEV